MSTYCAETGKRCIERGVRVGSAYWGPAVYSWNKMVIISSATYTF